MSKLDLGDYDISVRTWSCLKRSGINTVEDLCNITREDILRVRNLGRMNFEEILKLMYDNGWEFKTE